MQQLLLYEKIKQNPERLSSIKQCINKYNQKGIKYPSKIDDWKRFEKNNPKSTFNFLYTKEKEIFQTYISKINSNYEKQIILLMIPNKEKRMALSFSKKIICIITWNNFKT